MKPYAYYEESDYHVDWSRVCRECEGTINCNRCDHVGLRVLRLRVIATVLVLAALAVPAVAQERTVRIPHGWIQAVAPKQTPADAAAVVANLPRPVFPEGSAPRGVDVVVAGRPQDGPFGPFPPQPVMAPLTCCGVYRWNLPATGPYPRYENGPHRR